MIHERWNGSGYSAPSGYLHIVQDLSKNNCTYKSLGFNITNVASLYPVTTIALRNTYAWERAQAGVTFDLLGATGYSLGINNLNNTTNTISKFSINNDVGFSGSDMVTIDSDSNFTYRPLVGIGNPNPQFTMDISGTCRVSNNMYCNTTIQAPLFQSLFYGNFNWTGTNTPTMTCPSFGNFIWTFGANIVNVAALGSVSVLTGAGGNCFLYNVATRAGTYQYTFTATGDYTFTVSNYNLPWTSMSATYIKIG
jgi:hypothetical protein